VQHAHSKPKEEDPERPLTAEGRAAAKLVANVAAKLNLGIEWIYHSGKLRARQTAEILAEALDPCPGIEAKQGLDPLDAVGPIAEWLRREASERVGAVALVGHLPFLDRLASLLIADNEDACVVSFQYAGLIKLVPSDVTGRYSVQWILTPDIAKACS